MTFEAKLLYEQMSAAEEETRVLSSVYAVSWLYPGAITKTTARVRTTFVYHIDAGGIDILGGTIEKWRSEGWTLIEEYHDAQFTFLSLDECRQRMIKIAESFLTAVPLRELDSTYSSLPDFTPESSPSPKRNFKVIDYHEKKKKKSAEKSSKGNKDDEKKDDNNFDWV